MKNNVTYPILVGVIIALSGTFLMLVLLAFGFVGPKSVLNDNLMYGGTILFASLYLFLLLGIFKALKKRKRSNENSLSFSDAFKTGLIVSVSTAITSVILTILFYEVFYPKYNQEMIEIVSHKMQSTQLTSLEVEKKVVEQAKYYSTSVQAQFSFVGNLLTGIVFTLLLTLFLRTRNTYIKR